MTKNNKIQVGDRFSIKHRKYYDIYMIVKVDINDQMILVNTSTGLAVNSPYIVNNIWNITREEFENLLVFEYSEDELSSILSTQVKGV